MRQMINRVAVSRRFRVRSSVGENGGWESVNVEGGVSNVVATTGDPNESIRAMDIAKVAERNRFI